MTHKRGCLCSFFGKVQICQIVSKRKKMGQTNCRIMLAFTFLGREVRRKQLLTGSTTYLLFFCLDLLQLVFGLTAALRVVEARILPFWQAASSFLVSSPVACCSQIATGYPDGLFQKSPLFTKKKQLMGQIHIWCPCNPSEMKAAFTQARRVAR